jgi:transcriptional regulator NrdR family protein
MKKQELIEKLKLTGTVSANVFINVSEVITMIEDLEESESSESHGLTQEDVESIVNQIASKLNDEGEHLIDSYDICADVNGRNIEIELEDVTYDRYEIESIVERVLSDYINVVEEEEKQETN